MGTLLFGLQLHSSGRRSWGGGGVSCINFNQHREILYTALYSNWNSVVSEFHVCNTLFPIFVSKFHVYSTLFPIFVSSFHVYNTMFHIFVSKFHVYDTPFPMLISKFHVYNTLFPIFPCQTGHV